MVLEEFCQIRINLFSEGTQYIISWVNGKDQDEPGEDGCVTRAHSLKGRSVTIGMHNCKVEGSIKKGIGVFPNIDISDPPEARVFESTLGEGDRESLGKTNPGGQGLPPQTPPPLSPRLRPHSSTAAHQGLPQPSPIVTPM